MGHAQEEFAEFYRASKDSCLKAVTAVVGDRQLAEELTAEAFARAWTSWGKVSQHAAPRAWVVRTAHTRKAVFFGYTYRWTAIRDRGAPMRASGWFGRLNPVQQQLLGGAEAGDGDHAWGHYPDATPLYEWLNERGFLDPANRPLKP